MTGRQRDSEAGSGQDQALKKGPAPTMAAWRKHLFIATSHITADAAEHLGLPRDRTVVMGSQIDV